MYTLTRARYRLDRRAGRWVEGDLSAALVSTLSTVYGEVYLYVQSKVQGVDAVRALYWPKLTALIANASSTMTVQQWLTSLGTTTLPFEAALPKEKETLVRYAQAWHAGYSVNSIGDDPYPGRAVSKFAKKHLILQHPTHKPQDVRDNCLITVQGYFHLCDWNDEGVMILEGNKTVRQSNNNQVGIYSLEGIGKLKYVPITTEMISAQNATSPLWDATYLTMPDDIDIENKTVLLVTGGYLNILSSVYERVADRTWRLHFGNMMFLDRYITSARDLDLSSLGLSTDTDDPTKFSVAQLKNDDVIRAYLTLSQSFFVVVDSNSFFHSFEPVQYLNLPGRFVSDKYDRIPLVGAYGHMLDYHVIEEPTVVSPVAVPNIPPSYVYCSVENRRHDYDAHHTNWQDQPIVNGGRYPYRPDRHETAYFLYMGTNG